MFARSMPRSGQSGVALLCATASVACVPQQNVRAEEETSGVLRSGLTCNPHFNAAQTTITLGVGGDEVIAASDMVVWVGFQPRSASRTTLTAFDLGGAPVTRFTATCPCTGAPVADRSGDVVLTQMTDGSAPATVVRLGPDGTPRWRRDVGVGAARLAATTRQGVLVDFQDASLIRETIVLDSNTGDERWRASGLGSQLSDNRIMVVAGGEYTLHDNSGGIVARLNEVQSYGPGFYHVGDLVQVFDYPDARVVAGRGVDVVAVAGSSLWIRGPSGTFEYTLPRLDAYLPTCLPPGAEVSYVRDALSFVDEEGHVGVSSHGRWWVTPPGALREGDRSYPDSVWQVPGGFVVSVEHRHSDGLTGRTLLVTGIDPS